MVFTFSSRVYRINANGNLNIQRTTSCLTGNKLIIIITIIIKWAAKF